MKKLLNFTFFACLIFIAPKSFARENVSDWYIKDFKTNIDVKSDSTLEITETITADCGQNQRHGIFRILPTQQILENKKLNSSITLYSITNKDGKSYKYQTINDRVNKNVTWKIGDPKQFVTGENIYVIKYSVKNAIRHDNPNFDELYWNLNGNFWEMETDNFEANINFPSGINQNNISLETYLGGYGDKGTDQVSIEYASPNTLQVKHPKTLAVNEGITLSASFPKNIISEYSPSFLEKYGGYFWFILPLAVLFFCFTLWKKFGDDPSINPTIAPEFEIPEQLAPIEMGLLQTDGLLKSNFVTASIINLAVNGHIKIEKIKKKNIIASEDFNLTKLTSKYKPSAGEKKLLSGLFESGTEVRTSTLKNKFYKNLEGITDVATNYLCQKRFLVRLSRLPQWIMLFVGIVTTFFSLVGYTYNIPLGLSLSISGIIILIFSFIMPRRTREGAELLRRVKGFRLYLDKVEKYRQQFLEKENTFEKMLPYAILFGMTKEYIRKIKSIYGAEYFTSYHPAWYLYGSVGSFNIDSFSSQLSHLSGQMSTTIASAPSSSGSGGGGFSGGGGGGGGGGGW